jgi:hypothetical protein
MATKSFPLSGGWFRLLPRSIPAEAESRAVPIGCDNATERQAEPG